MAYHLGYYCSHELADIVALNALSLLAKFLVIGLMQVPRIPAPIGFFRFSAYLIRSQVVVPKFRGVDPVPGSRVETLTKFRWRRPSVE